MAHIKESLFIQKWQVIPCMRNQTHVRCTSADDTLVLKVKTKMLIRGINYHIVNSMIALTMSFLLFLRAFIAFARDTLAWDTTRSMSFSSTSASSTSSSDSSWIGAGTCDKNKIDPPVYLKKVKKKFNKVPLFHELQLQLGWVQGPWTSQQQPYVPAGSSPQSGKRWF